MEVEVRAFFNSLESKPSYSVNTRQAYQKDVRSFLEYLEKTLQRTPNLVDVNSRQIAAYLESERQQGRKVSTLFRRRAALRRFHEFLKQEGLVQSELLNMDEHLIWRSTSLENPRQTSSSLSEDQVDLLWKALGESQRPLARRDHAILAVLLETGLSVSTLIALNLPDLDLRSGKLHFRTETEEDCWLPLANAVKALEAYIQEGRPELNPSPDDPALFISQTGARMSRQSVWQVLRHWGQAANMPVTISPRVIRHTAALRMARAGRSLTEIQMFLGHSNPLSTQALLNRLNTEDLRGPLSKDIYHSGEESLHGENR